MQENVVQKETAWVSAESAIPQIAKAFDGDTQKAESTILDFAARSLLRAKASYRCEVRIDEYGNDHAVESKDVDVPNEIWRPTLAEAYHFDWKISEFRGRCPDLADPKLMYWVVLIGLRFSQSDLTVLRKDIKADQGKTRDLPKAVPEGLLRKWLASVPNRTGLTHRQLADMAAKAFPGMAVRRDPFRKLLRELDGVRTPGVKRRT